MPIVASFERLVRLACDGTSGLAEPLDELMRSVPFRCAAVIWKADCLFVSRSKEPLAIAVDGRDAVPMTRVEGADLLTHIAQLTSGGVHPYRLLRSQDSAEVHGGYVAGFGHLSHPMEGVPTGLLSDRLTIKSRIYGGAESDYWIYANPGIDTIRGAPVMVWLDGHTLIGAYDALVARMQTVTDNLAYLGLIPPMVHILLAPAVGGDRQLPKAKYPAPVGSIRQIQYDEMSDEFARHLVEEVLPRVGAEIRLRRDGYSRGIAGWSSGGACAFNVGWFAPHEFSRVHSVIGSFTAIAWNPDRDVHGAHEIPFLVRRESRRNLRVWLSDGAQDLDLDAVRDPEMEVASRAGSWPLANLQMAQALKVAGYDFHFRFGVGGHDGAQFGLDLPESLTWLWRDYDPARDHQTFEQDPAERNRPPYRVQVINRDSW